MTLDVKAGPKAGSKREAISSGRSIAMSNESQHLLLEEARKTLAEYIRSITSKLNVLADRIEHDPIPLTDETVVMLYRQQLRVVVAKSTAGDIRDLMGEAALDKLAGGDVKVEEALLNGQFIETLPGVH